MDIKWKNNHLNKFALILLAYLLSLSFLLASDFIRHRDYLSKNPYFNSGSFKNEIDNLFQNIKSFHIYYEGYEKKSQGEKLNAYEIDSTKEKYASVLKNNKEEYEAKVSAAIQELIENKDKDYSQLKKALSSKNDIKYYIKNRKTGDIYTNFEIVPDIKNYLEEKSLYSISFPKELNRTDSFWSINNSFKNSTLEGYFIVPKEIEGFSQIMDNYNYYNSIRSRILWEGLILAVALGLVIFILTYLKNKKELDFQPIDKALDFLRKIPIDLRAFIFILWFFFTLIYISNINFFYIPLNLDHLLKLTFTAILLLYGFLNLLDIYKLTKNKEELLTQWRKSFLVKINSFIKESFINKNTFTTVFFITMFTSFFGFFICLALMSVLYGYGEIFFIYIIYIGIYLIIYIYYALKKISLFNRILEGSEEIIGGNLNYVIDEQGGGSLSKLANNINNMKVGFKKSIESQIKSERLKSELITNVSHDLKTPLTSIINYVDLLKKEDLSKEEMDGYIGILDRKTQRLKVLIEDLFEASKVTSGSIELNMEKVDIASLLSQALGEFDEKINNSPVTFKVNAPKHKVYAPLDGKKTWRVFENLINNALKYSQPNTRVYLDLVEEENKVTFTIKNIASYEMDFDVNEVFERFKRGDKSRNTEGSGLGLAIAKSIVELQGGSLNIEIDGDLFKAIVQFYKEHQ